MSNQVNAIPARRRARAQVREAVLKLEYATPKWINIFGPRREFEPDAWDAAARAVEVECLAARVPRRLTEDFVESTRAMSLLLRWSHITANEMDIVVLWRRGHLELLNDYLWHPSWTRLRYGRRLKALASKRKELDALSKQLREERKSERQDP